ncbi:MAG: YdeI/OmpD-associated family protein [Bacteroidota bacterium]
MPRFEFTQTVEQLEKRKGGYFYLFIDVDTVNQFEHKRATRLKCEIDGKLSYSCGLNHLGDGNFYIIVSGARMKKLEKTAGDTVTFGIYEDPNPLGVEIPDVLLAFLEQDEEIKKQYEALTDGKKRTLIYSIQKVKNIDLQIEKINTFFKKK